MEGKEQEFHHTITVENVTELKKKINITYDSIGVQKVMAEAAKSVGKRIQIKGFRRGKAPIQLVETHCRKEIDLTARSLLSQRGFFHACNEHKLFVLKEPEFEDPEINDDGTFTCEIVVDVRPQIEPHGYMGLQLTKKVVDREEIVQRLLKSLKEQHSSDVQGDEIKLGSIANFDFTATVGEEEISSGLNHPFMIMEGQDPPFNDSLVGMKVGEERKETMTLPETFKEYGGQEAHIQMELKGVINKVSATDEELVERTESPSFEALLDVIQQNAEYEASQSETRAVEELAMDKLIELHEFEVPEDWVNDEFNYLKTQVGLTEKPDKETYKFMRNLSERNVRRTFILDAIYVSEPSVAITNEDMDQFFQAEAQKKGVSSLKLKADLKKTNMLDSVMAAIKHRKILDFILSHAQIVVEDGAPEPQQSENIVIPDNPLE